MTGSKTLIWEIQDRKYTAAWFSSNGRPTPTQLQVVDDTLSASQALRLIRDGFSLLWTGDFQNCRHLLLALERRLQRKRSDGGPAKITTLNEKFWRHRAAQAERAQILGAVLVEITAKGEVPLRRAPDVRTAWLEAAGVNASAATHLISVRELLGLVGAHEWRKKGLLIPALGNKKLTPHFGVFAPVRSEYLDLLVQAPLNGAKIAFDIGTGTGVLAAILASRGVAKVIATDIDSRALVCAQSNIESLGLAQQIEICSADLFPSGKADLIVCNPPWLPLEPSSSLETAVYDPNSRMLKAFLAGVTSHLTPSGEAWLILSDLAERLGLRTETELEVLFQISSLQVVGRLTCAPIHRKARDSSDPLYTARSAEIISLWRLKPLRDS